MRVGLTTIVVREYDEAIRFYIDAVGFELIADDDQGGGKRWVVVTPPGRSSGLLLARASNAAQLAAVGNQTGGRGGLFLHSAALHRPYPAERAGGGGRRRGPPPPPARPGGVWVGPEGRRRPRPGVGCASPRVSPPLRKPPGSRPPPTPHPQRKIGNDP